MKSIQRLILFVFIIIIGCPFAIGALALSKDASLPNYFTSFNYTEFNYEKQINDNLQSILLSNVIGERSVSIDEEFVSKALHTYFSGYTHQRVIIPELNNATLAINNIWVTFDNNVFSVFGIVSYNNTQTTLTIKISISNLDDGLKIAFNTVKIGKLPIPKIIFTKILQYIDEANDITKGYPFGNVDINELFITIKHKYIDEQITQLFGADLIIFDSLILKDKKIYLNYQFNPNNTLALAIDTTVKEIKNIVSSEQVREDIKNVLDQNDPIEKQFNESLVDVLDIIKEKVTTSELNQNFKEEELLKFEKMANEFSSLEVIKQESVIEAIINNMDEENKIKIEELLLQNGNNSLNDLLSSFLGNKITN